MRTGLSGCGISLSTGATAIEAKKLHAMQGPDGSLRAGKKTEWKARANSMKIRKVEP